MKISYTTLIDGKSFNQIIRDIKPEERVFRSFRNWILFDNGNPKYPVSEEETIDISLEQDRSVLLFIYKNSIFWSSSRDVIFLNPNCRNMFSSIDIENIDLIRLNPGIVKDISYMFSNCLNLRHVWLRGLDPENILFKVGTFSGMESLEKIHN